MLKLCQIISSEAYNKVYKTSLKPKYVLNKNETNSPEAWCGDECSEENDKRDATEKEARSNVVRSVHGTRYNNTGGWVATISLSFLDNHNHCWINIQFRVLL